MYTVSVPVMNKNAKRCGRERLLKEIRRLDAGRVFLACTYESDAEKRANNLKELKENCKFFKDNGFEVGAWFWTFWVKNNAEFTNMRSIKGAEIKEFMCPSDERFVQYAMEYIKDVAECGVDIIQFDDDFRYGFLSDSPACLCDRHIALINAITGENSTREELEKYITTGGKNKYRDAYLKANGDAFRNFARAARETVDAVNPAIRLSLCSCMSSWDVDGTDAYELAKILAGNTKPLLRLIGAPYWAVNNRSWCNGVQDVVELSRMESAWSRRGEIEIMAEGDVFPRPRIDCPAAYLEGFDTAVRVAGCTDGILKYGLDYTSNADYETGYATFHERNRDTYKAIQEMFDDKTSCGVRVYESMKKVSDMVMPTKVNREVNIQDLFFSKAARSLSYTGIPTVYEGEGLCGIAFDENARNLPQKALENGLILDIAAAEILTEQGIDVGLVKIGDVTRDNDSMNVSLEEHFLWNDNYLPISNVHIYDIALKETATVLSDAATSKGKVPMSYTYENADGNRFLVLNLNTRYDDSSLLRQYERSRQYADTIPWLSQNKLPAYVYGHPALYMQCKRNEDALAVGLWNFFADIAITPVVQLDKAYTAIKCINCDARLEGDKVYLDDIAAFGFVGFEVK